MPVLVRTAEQVRQHPSRCLPAFVWVGYGPSIPSGDVYHRQQVGGFFVLALKALHVHQVHAPHVVLLPERHFQFKRSFFLEPSGPRREPSNG